MSTAGTTPTPNDNNESEPSPSSSTTTTTTSYDYDTKNIYPTWLEDDDDDDTDASIDPAWLFEKTGIACSKCSVQDVSNQGRKAEKTRDGATLKLTVTLKQKEDDDETTAPSPLSSLSIILKQVPERGRSLSMQLGLAREALFYQNFQAELPHDTVPHIYYAAGDMKTGAKVVLMQDLSQVAVDSGVFFGPGNPNNWNRDLDAQVARATTIGGGNNNDKQKITITTAQVAETTFRSMAKIHAHFWKRKEDLLTPDKQWLRGQAWLQGQGRESWEASQGIIRTIWESVAPNVDSKIKWDPLVRAAAFKAVNGISWDAQLERLHVDGPWTLVHGDFWPGNVMWMIQDQSIRLLDWEMCGLGSGGQELGQYVLSNMEPSERRACERQLVEAYYDELRQGGVEDVTREYCWNEYKIGGLERWLWFLVYFLGQDSLSGWAQFFHDQMASFMHDHGLTADDVVQVRP